MPAELDRDENVRRNRRFFDGPFGPVYSFYMEHERVSRLVARVVWGSDVRPFYAGMRAISELPADATVGDAPCGAGVAFRAIGPRKEPRYLAVDLSQRMLERARRRGAERGLERIEFRRADARAIPLGDAEVDLFCSYFGLHCFPDPEAALGEAARCLHPGGRLIGGTIVTGASLRQRLLVRPGHGAFGPVGDAGDLASWLESAQFTDVELDEHGEFVYFSATRARRTIGPGMPAD
jgi:SAM-dependent methyltransferase